MSGQNCLNQRGLIQVQIKTGKNVSLLQTYLDIRPGAMNFNFVQKVKLHTLPSLCTFTHSPTAMNDGETIETMNQLFQNSEPTCEDSGIGETGNRCTIRQD